MPKSKIVRNAKLHDEIIKEYLSQRGRELGLVKSDKKREAVRRNLEKALEKRWGKKITLRKESAS